MARAIGVVDRSHECKNDVDAEMAHEAYLQSLGAIRRLCEIGNTLAPVKEPAKVDKWPGLTPGTE